MRNTILCLIFLVGSFSTAQVQTPQPSPSSHLSQTVGLTEVNIKFSRPGKKGRVVFGDLVPYGKLWRTGANKNTTISFSDPVTIGGNQIAAGEYAIFTRPGKSMWEVIFYNDTSNWGTPSDWDADKVSASVEVTPTEGGSIESFSIWISNLHNNGAILNMGWDTSRIAIPIEVPTVAKASASIKAVMKNNPKHRDYYSAAVYYLQEGQDLNKAKEWIAKAVEGKSDAYWYFRQQSLILAGLNDKEGAIAAAKTSLELATKAGNPDYVSLNEASLAEWAK